MTKFQSKVIHITFRECFAVAVFGCAITDLRDISAILHQKQRDVQICIFDRDLAGPAVRKSPLWVPSTQALRNVGISNDPSKGAKQIPCKLQDRRRLDPIKRGKNNPMGCLLPPHPTHHRNMQPSQHRAKRWFGFQPRRHKRADTTRRLQADLRRALEAEVADACDCHCAIPTGLAKEVPMVRHL